LTNEQGEKVGEKTETADVVIQGELRAIVSPVEFPLTRSR
jgi:hypothetical protein